MDFDLWSLYYIYSSEVFGIHAGVSGIYAEVFGIHAEVSGVHIKSIGFLFVIIILYYIYSSEILYFRYSLSIENREYIMQYQMPYLMQYQMP